MSVPWGSLYSQVPFPGRWEPVQSGLMSGGPGGGGATQSGPMWSTRSRGSEALYGVVNAPVL